MSEASSSKAVPSLSTNKNKDIKAAKSRKRTEATPEFQAWWQLYLSIPLEKRVISQTKPKAWEEWQKAVKQYTADQLMIATQAAIKQVKGMSGDYRLPDAARWLRESRYEALIDTATATQQQAPPETLEEAQARLGLL